MKPRIAFVIEQALGHVAYGQSLRAALAGRDDIEQVWIDVPFEPQGAGAWPVLRSNWTLRGSLLARKLVGAEEKARGPLDACFLHTQTIALFSGGLMKRVPVLLSLDATPRNLDQLAGSYEHRVGSRPAEAFKRVLHRRIVRRAARFTTWSRWAKESLVADYGADPALVTVAHPGTQISIYADPATKPERRAATPLRVLFVGADFERKGGDLLLEAARRLSGRIELDVVTKSDVAPEPHVHVHRGLSPHSAPLLDLYRTADVFALPTRGDCLAVVMGEAMAAALPIITTDVGAHREAVADGESGFIVGVDDIDVLCDRLTRLADDPALARLMGQRARAFGEDAFDINKTAHGLADILVALTEGRAGKAVQPALEAIAGERTA
jgi:glycosyltransferase involved in cell wall biosynthesis